MLWRMYKLAGASIARFSDGPRSLALTRGEEGVRMSHLGPSENQAGASIQTLLSAMSVHVCRVRLTTQLSLQDTLNKR